MEATEKKPEVPKPEFDPGFIFPDASKGPVVYSDPKTNTVWFGIKPGMTNLGFCERWLDSLKLQFYRIYEAIEAQKQMASDPNMQKVITDPRGRGISAMFGGMKKKLGL